LSDAVAGAWHRHGPGHGPEEHISAFTWQGGDELDRRRFERFLGCLPPEIYRAKGLVRFSGASWPCLFNYTCGRWELNWIQLGDAVQASQAVFIGRDAQRLRERTLAALEACRAR
jgi:G3E family GTPase